MHKLSFHLFPPGFVLLIFHNFSEMKIFFIFFCTTRVMGVSLYSQLLAEIAFQ